MFPVGRREAIAIGTGPVTGSGMEGKKLREVSSWGGAVDLRVCFVVSSGLGISTGAKEVRASRTDSSASLPRPCGFRLVWVGAWSTFSGSRLQYHRRNAGSQVDARELKWWTSDFQGF